MPEPTRSPTTSRAVTARDGPFGRDDLADPVAPGLRHPAAPEVTTELVHPVRGRDAQTNGGRPTSPTGASLDETEVEIMNVVDDHSRSPGCLGCPRVFKAAHVVGELPRSRWGPKLGCRPRCSPTTGPCSPPVPRKGADARDRSRDRRSLGIRSRALEPHHPQTCGKVERFHQKRQAVPRPPASRSPPTLAELQAQLDRFRDYYNTVRPHRAIGRRTPAEAFAARPKAPLRRSPGSGRLHTCG